VGFGEKLKSALGMGNRSQTPMQEALKTTGTVMVSFATTGARLESQEDVKNLLKREPPDTMIDTLEIFEYHVKNWHKTFELFKNIAVAWGRAGDNQAYGRMFFAVNGIAKEIEVAIINNRAILQRIAEEIKIINEDNKDKEDKTCNLVYQQKQLITEFVEAYLVNAGYLYVDNTSDACWFDKDVSTPLTVVVQTIQPIQQDRAKVNEELIGKEGDVSD
jgi:hypothetical protein